MIKPLPGYVLIEPIDEEMKVGDVYVPETSKDKPSKGKVVAVGDSLLAGKGFFVNTPVEKDQVVVYKKWTNQEVNHEGKSYLLVKFDELLGAIE